MPEHDKITGIEPIDSDLHDLFALVDDSQRLAAAKQAVANEDLDIKQLASSVSPGVIQVVLALSDDDEVAAIASQVEDAPAKARLQDAARLVREHFPRLYHHPAVVREMRQKMDRPTSDAEDKEGKINGVYWAPSWQDQSGKLSPAGLLQLRDRANKVLLTSPLDWDDIAFLISALCRQLATHMEKSKPIVHADLLVIPDADKISQRIEEASHALQRIRELGAGIGLAAPESEREGK